MAEKIREEAGQLLEEVSKRWSSVGRRRRGQKAITVAELCDDYLKYAEAGRVPTLRDAVEKTSRLRLEYVRLKWHIKPVLGKLHVPSVTRENIEAFMCQIAEGGSAARRSTGQVLSIVDLLGTIFAYAVRRKLRADNPVLGVMRYADVRWERRLSHAEYAMFGTGLALAALPVQSIRPGARPPGLMWPSGIAAVRFLSLTGWRRGEAIGLRWGDLDLLRRIARLQNIRTGLSVRPLSLAACRLLAEQGRGELDALVFPPAKGQSLVGGFPWLFARIVKAGGLSVDVTPLVLRHSFASLANDLGFSKPIIAALVGYQGHSVASGSVHAADATLLAAADAVAERVVELLNGAALVQGHGLCQVDGWGATRA